MLSVSCAGLGQPAFNMALVVGVRSD